MTHADLPRALQHGPSLSRHLLFALFAGLGALPWQLLFGVVWSFEACLGPYLLALVVASAIVTAPWGRRALPAALLACALCARLALISPGVASATLGALIALGLTRSAVLYPRPFARALAFELALALPSATAFAVLHDGAPIGDSLAVWSFWLVQSAFALLPGKTGEGHGLERDPFEAAVSAADELMRSS
jgi:hypothetical protein